MPSSTPDQQIPRPVDPDTADNPVAFNAAVAIIEPRLVREYTTEADRTARMLALTVNDISSLSTPAVGPARLDAWSGSAHVSLATRSLYSYIRKAPDETIGNSTVLQDDDNLLVALPATGTFQFELNIFYASTTVADIKFAFTFPVLAICSWAAIGLATAATTSAGDGNFGMQNTSGTAISYGGIGAVNPLPIQFFGDIIMGGTAGNLVLQWAKANAEATNTTVFMGSNLKVWRVA